MDRRRFLRDLALAGVGGMLASREVFGETAKGKDAPAAPPASTFGIASGKDPSALTLAALAALGGIGKFVSKGHVVVIKPNIGWDRTPFQAANTNPQVVATLVKECLKAGAKRVIITDNPCNDPQRCFLHSEIEPAVKEAGGEIVLPDDRRYKEMNVGGELVKLWAVDPIVLEADVRINVPVAKHHGLAEATLGMKNWYGAVGGARNKLHQNVYQSSVDLARFFRPQLTVLDAYRVLLRNGPQGGNPRDVKMMGIVAASADPVAIDAYGSTLFGMEKRQLRNVVLAEKAGLGTADYDSLDLKRTEVPA